MQYPAFGRVVEALSSAHAIRKIMPALGVFFVVMCPILASCTPQNEDNTTPEKYTEVNKNTQPILLSISGYNYTSRHIESFSVNGAGGGNIFVSTPTSGGGGSACCVRYRPGTRVRKIMVEWQSGGCFFRTKSPISEEMVDSLHPYSYRREVEVDSTIAADPLVMEIHFYPDGRIEAAITSGISSPRLRLDPSREDGSNYLRCPNDQERKD